MKLLHLTEASQTMKLYHGAQRRFDRFDLSKVNPNGFAHGMGFHFVSDLSLAKQYAGPEGFVYVADITVSNPLLYTWPAGPGLKREKVVALGHDSFMIKERNYIEMIIFDISQIALKDVMEMS